MAKNTDIIRSDKNVSETPKKHEMWNDLTLKLVLYGWFFTAIQQKSKWNGIQ